MPRYDSFIVRTWSHGGELLHGYIVHVATKRQVAFTTLLHIPDFIQGQLGTDTLRQSESEHEDMRHLDPEAGTHGRGR
jgi:hypothetical protein